MRVLGKMANAATRGLRKPAFWRGVISIPAFLLFWEIGARSQEWFGVAFPWVSQVPAPTAVTGEMWRLLQDPSFWYSAYLSTVRVFEGFFAAMVIGIPLGLTMAVSRWK